MKYFIAKEASFDLDEILDYFLVRNINAKGLLAQSVFE